MIKRAPSLLRTALQLPVFCLTISAGAQTLLIQDAFDDGTLEANVNGIGHGFVNRGQANVTETGSVAFFAGDSGFSSYVMTSNVADAMNPFQATPTTLVINFGIVGYDANFTRNWVGYRLSGDTSDHFAPRPAEAVPVAQGLYLSMRSVGDPNTTGFQGNLVAVSNTGSYTTLATWILPGSSSNVGVQLTTTDSTYAIGFFNTGNAPVYFSGAASGSLGSALGTITTNFDIGAHWQDSSDGQVLQIDAITLMGTAAVPEPSTYAVLAGVVALGFAAWRRRVRRPLMV